MKHKLIYLQLWNQAKTPLKQPSYDVLETKLYNNLTNNLWLSALRALEIELKKRIVYRD